MAALLDVTVSSVSSARIPNEKASGGSLLRKFLRPRTSAAQAACCTIGPSIVRSGKAACPMPAARPTCRPGNNPCRGPGSNRGSSNRKKASIHRTDNPEAGLEEFPFPVRRRRRKETRLQIIPRASFSSANSPNLPPAERRSAAMDTSEISPSVPPHRF